MPFEIIRNDITRMRVDAIVNAANNSLLGGGGVDGAIHRAAGPELLAECRSLGGCETGQAKITKGYRLPAKYVIHTVGPIWHGGRHGEKELLTACYRHSLELAELYKCETVAFPLISAGAYGYPKAEAVKVATDAIRDFLLFHDLTVYLVVYDRTAFSISEKLYAHIQAFIDDAYIKPEEEETERSRRLSDQVCYGAPSAPPDSSGWPKDAAFMPSEQTYSAVKRKAEPEKKNRLRELFPKKKQQAMPSAPIEKEAESPSPASSSLREYLAQMDEGFRDMLLRKIDEKGMTDAECYKKANIDRKLFNKIKNQPGYRPSKPTVLAFAVALELPLDETREMLAKAGFSLTHSCKFDLIVEYFIVHGQYDIFGINEALFAFDQNLLGTGMNPAGA